MANTQEHNPEPENRDQQAASMPLASAGYLSLGTPTTGLRKWRGAKDGFSRYFVATGGLSVIVALALIFVYLFWEVAPMLLPAKMTHVATYQVPGPSEAQTLHIATERYMEVAVRFADDGSVTFFDPGTGEIKLEQRLPIPDGVSITSVGAGEPRTRLLGFGLSNGQIILVQHEYDLSYPDGVRLVSPKLTYPFGDEPIDGFDELHLAPGESPGAGGEDQRAITNIGVQRGSDGSVSAAIATQDGRLRLVRFSVRRTLFATETTKDAADLTSPNAPITNLMLSMDLRDLLVGDDRGTVHYYDVSRPAQARLMQSEPVLDTRIASMEYLLGTVSIVVGGADGSVLQWMLVRDDDNVRDLRHVRSFQQHASPITAIIPEHARKGFLTTDESGHLSIHFSTSHKTLLSRRISEVPVRLASFAPSANGLIAVDVQERLHFYTLHNPHPQASISALWGRVWYEGYEDPQYRWESSSATDEFEPKLSLVPLTVGTIKAAFYAMLFAVPIAIMGAIYSAYFMTPKMRGFVKPSIEIMEALPTVILGFLAGLWFAPFVENHLPAVFSVLILMPLGVLAFAFAWSRIPASVRAILPRAGDWEAAILIPVMLAIGWLCIAASPIVEVWFFGGSMRQWFTDIGITYDQRNAMIVGIAMGFAVIPTIFSITEDAIFNVPRHLTQGSLALGATPWQTMMRVVLLTASPGIFSAVMIGLGRAVGETMIVLMATGNSPITKFNIFEGMRTLSANIAVEMPETEVGGTHYRILFLSALVLFILTFMFNTAAEIVRQRLRMKYATI